MVYESSQDKELQAWRISLADDQTAIVSLRSYNSGDPKLVIGPTEIDRDGKIIHARVKRWGWSELLKLQDAITEAIDKMDALAAGKN